MTSEIMLNGLRHRIGEKLSHFPDAIQLRYRLDCDKAKDGMISIQTDDKFDLFLARLKSLVTPQRTAAGKPSTRQLKKFLVQFEDASFEDQMSNHKAVCIPKLMITPSRLLMNIPYARLTNCTR